MKVIKAASLALGLAVSLAWASAQTVTVPETNGAFRVLVTLNGRLPASALIDTGASSLLICAPMAQVLELQLGEEVRLMTVSGTLTARRVDIESLRLGTIKLRNLPAIVLPHDPTCEVVLGLSVLRKLRSVTLRRKTLTMIAP